MLLTGNPCQRQAAHEWDLWRLLMQILIISISMVEAKRAAQTLATIYLLYRAACTDAFVVDVFALLCCVCHVPCPLATSCVNWLIFISVYES